MKNSEYWKLRFAQLEEAQNKLANEGCKEIERIYRQTLKEIEGKIDTWYKRLAKNNEISMVEARKFLSGSELEEFKWDVHDYIKYGKENAVSWQWVKQLENASAKFHISKYEALKIQTQQSFENLFAKQKGITSGTMAKVYKSGYYHTAFEIQKGFGVGWDISGIDQNQVEKVLTKPWAVDGKNFSERIWSNKQKLISEVHNELTQNIITGADPQRAINAIASKLNASKSNAGRLVMTEEAYFSSAAQKDCFDDLGVEEYEIVATLDAHTSEICQSMDGKHFPMKDFQAGVTAPPFHPWCRSTTCPYFADDYGEPGGRAARREDGKTYHVPAHTTYKDWKESFVDSKDKSGLQEVDKFENGDIINLYKDKGLSVISDDDIAPNTIKTISEATEKVTSDFKTLEKYSEDMRFSDVVGGLAENVYRLNTGLNIISLDKKSFSNPSGLLEILKKDFASGVSYETDTIQILVAHEMGHNAHIALALKKANIPYGKPLSLFETRTLNEQYQKISEEIYNAAFKDESLQEIWDRCGNELGSITVGNPRELIAQSFGNYYFGVTKSRIAEKIVKYFMKELK